MNDTTLSDVNGILCVQYRSTDYREPFINVSNFPTGIHTNGFMRNFNITSLDQLEIVYQLSHGIYEFCIKDNLCGPKWKIQLKDGGTTKGIGFEKIPIICPKVRTGVKTRYNGDKGYWEKELKYKWVMI